MDERLGILGSGKSVVPQNISSLFSWGQKTRKTVVSLTL